MNLSLARLPGFAISTLSLALLFAGTSQATHASAHVADHPPGPISVLPDFHCDETPEVCLKKVNATLKENLLPLDIEKAQKPDLVGPSDYWGQSEYTSADHRVPVVAVLMHGMFEDGRQLAPEAAWFAQHGVPVLNIVLMGHGMTNKIAEDVLYTDWIEDAERAMRLARAMGDRVILVGHSTGGALSVYLGIKYPDAVAAAVLIEPAVRVTSLVQKAACISQREISNVTDYPELLKIYGVNPKDLHNQVISPAAGCEVKDIRKAALSLLPSAPFHERSIEDLTRGDLDDDSPRMDTRSVRQLLANSHALGQAFKAPLLLFNNKYDIVVDTDQNEAFAEGVALHGIANAITFDLDRKTPHGSITFSHVDWITSQLGPFLSAQGISL